MRCRRRCVGLEIPWPNYVPVDQAWKSATDGRNWQFSGFAYCFLSFDIELHGFNHDSPTFTESELTWFKSIPYMRSLLAECRSAAECDGDTAILEHVRRILEMLDLWEGYLRFREQAMKNKAGDRK